MKEIRMPILEVTGAYNGRYEVREQHDDGSLLIAPDTSLEAIMRRLDSQPATAEEFQAALGDLPTDGEG